MLKKFDAASDREPVHHWKKCHRCTVTVLSKIFIFNNDTNTACIKVDIGET